MTLLHACSAFATLADVYVAEHCPLESPADDVLVAAALEQASDMMYVLTGGKVHGVCLSTVYPEANDCGFTVVGPWSKSVVALRGPGTGVAQVKIDGVALDPTEYTLVDGNLLMRVEGDWPSNNLAPPVDDTELGTWSITYWFGNAPDFLTKHAAVELAIELAKGAKGQSTSLPAGVVAGNIQGASLTIEERAGNLEGGGSEGLPALARFLGIYGVRDGGSVSTVWSPELDYGYTLRST